MCGGNACTRQTQIAVWMLVLDRKLGMADAEVLASHPALNHTDLDAAWDYYRANPIEIEQALWRNDTAANVPDGERPQAWVIASGRLLGVSDGAMRAAFDAPLAPADLDAAWAEYRADPRQVGRAAEAHRRAS